MFFRVNIPGFGNIFVQAPDQNAALAAAQQYLQSQGITVEQGAGNPTATGFAAGSIPQDALILTPNGQGGFNAAGGPTTPGNQLPQEEAPPPALPTPQAPEGNQPGQPPLIDPGAQFRAFLQGQGVSPGTTVGNQFERFAPLALDVFDVGTALDFFGPPGTFAGTNNPFQQFLGSNLGNLNDLGTNALQIFQRLAGGGNEQTEQFINPAAGSDQSLVLQNLARAALGGRTNTGFASRFGGSLIDRLRQQFRDTEQFNPQGAGTFMDFLNSRLNLFPLGGNV